MSKFLKNFHPDRVLPATPLPSNNDGLANTAPIDVEQIDIKTKGLLRVCYTEKLNHTKLSRTNVVGETYEVFNIFILNDFCL